MLNETVVRHLDPDVARPAALDQREQGRRVSICATTLARGDGSDKLVSSVKATKISLAPATLFTMTPPYTNSAGIMMSSRDRPYKGGDKRV